MKDLSTSTSDDWSGTVRELLLRVWGEQACQHSSDWPEVRSKLLAKMGVRIDEAVAEMSELFANDTYAEDPVYAVWRAFPMLDRRHSAELAALLTRAASARRGEKAKNRAARQGGVR